MDAVINGIGVFDIKLVFPAIGVGVNEMAVQELFQIFDHQYVPHTGKRKARRVAGQAVYAVRGRL